MKVNYLGSLSKTNSIFLLIILFFTLFQLDVNQAHASGCGNSTEPQPSFHAPAPQSLVESGGSSGGSSLGYYVPTSPNPSGHTCLSDNRVELYWQASSVYYAQENLIKRLFTQFFEQSVFTNLIAHAGGGGGAPAVPTVTYSYQINGQDPVYVGTNTSSGPIVTTPGVEYQFRVQACAGSVCVWSGYRSFSCTPPIPTVTLQSNPSHVIYNNSSTLTWTVTNATSCEASGGWSGSRSHTGGTQGTGALTATTTYSLSCLGEGGTAGATTTVTVSIPPPTVTLEANPSKVIYGDSSTLTWTATNATSCTAFDGWSGSKNLTGGSEVVTDLRDNTSYRLVCAGLGGTAQAQTAVVVETGTGAYIEPNKTVFRKDDEVILDYGVGTSNPATCSLRRGSVVVLSTVSSTGTYRTTAGSGEMTYTLDCPGNQATATIKTLPEFQET